MNTLYPIFIKAFNNIAHILAILLYPMTINVRLYWDI